MISLMFKILADASPWKRTLGGLPNDARKAGASAGAAAGSSFEKNLGAQAKSAILRYIGAGAVLGGISKLGADASKIMQDSVKEGLSPEAFQELEKAIEKTGLSLQDLRDTAKSAPEDFAKLMDTIRGGGGVMSNQSVKTLSDANQQLDSLKPIGAEAAAMGANALAAAWGGANAAAGAIATGIGNITGWDRMKGAGKSLTDRADNVAEALVGVPKIETQGVQERAIASLQRVNEANKWWESVGGNDVKPSSNNSSKEEAAFEKIVEEQKKATEEIQQLRKAFLDRL